MLPRLLVAMVAVVGVLGLVADREVRADGCFVWHGAADLKEPNQRAIIAWDGKTETLLLAVKYEGPAEDFAWVVPLPAKPEVKAIDADSNPFAEISRVTQMREKGGLEGEQGRVPAGEPVEVLDRKVAGVYDISILAAKDPAALADWLSKNGYAFPDKGKDVLKHYTNKDWVYAAMRIDPKQLGSDEAGKLKTGELQPVRFTFASKEMVYPLKISSINAGQTEVLLYLVADAPMVLASGPAAAGIEPDAIVPRAYFGGAYYLDRKYMTLKTAVAKELPLTWVALGLEKDAVRHLCKYKTVYASDAMKDDLTFRPFEPLAYWKARLEKAEHDDTPAGEQNRRTASCFLAALPQTDDGLSKTLVEDKDEAVRSALAENTNALPAQLQTLASDSSNHVRRLVAVNPATPAAIRVRMVTDDADLNVRAEIALRDLPADVQLRVAKDPQSHVRSSLACSRFATAEVFAMLLQDKDSIVRQNAAGNANLPASLKATLAENTDAKIRENVAAYEKTAPDVLARLATDADSSVRLAVAKNPKLPAVATEKMATDESVDVRRALGQRKDLPAEVTDLLAADSLDKYERQRAAQKKLPEAVLLRLAHDPDGRVRQLVAVNPFAGEAVLRLLAQDSDPDVCGFVTLNASAPETLVVSLAKSAEARTRFWAAGSVKMPPATLATLAKDADAEVRRAVAQNPHTPPDMLRVLEKDPEKAVAKAAQENPSNRSVAEP